MSKQLAVALLAFIGAFFAPLWTIGIAGSGIPPETRQYDAIYSIGIGLFNLVLVIPAMVFLILGRKKRSHYKVSLVLSLCSIGVLGILAVVLRISGDL